MPYKSKSQQRAFFAMEAKGELPKGTAKKWMAHTENFSELPDKVKAEKKAAFKVAFLTKLASLGLTPNEWFEQLTKQSDDPLSALIGGGMDIGKSALSGIASAVPTAAKAVGAGALLAPLAIGGAAGIADGYMNAPTSDDIEIMRKAELLGALKRHTQEVRQRMAQRQGAVR